jgi:iron complex transport system substrate-binding protein
MLPRRRVLAVPAVTAVLAACSTDGESTAAAGSPTADTGWSYTDSVGRTVTLDAPPTRIAGYTDTVGSLWNYGVQPVALFGWSSMEDDSQFDGKDTSAVQQVGAAYGEIDLEALAAAAPDVILVPVYPADSEDVPTDASLRYGFDDETQQAKVAEIAPLVTFTISGTSDEVAAEMARFATSLGDADVDATVEQAEQDFATASDRLRESAASGLSTYVIAAYEGEGIYTVRPQDEPTTAYFQTLGMNLPDPGGEDYYWFTFSFENADGLTSDLILSSPRSMAVEDLMAVPTFASLPAAAADQVFSWEPIQFDHVSQARSMNEIAGWLESARKVV